MPSLSSDGIDYYYREAGQGPLVVLGHSDASSSAQWRALMGDLAGEFCLRAFDTSGQGRSGPWPKDRPFSIAAEGRVVDALVEDAEEPVHLVGHSMGAALALTAAARLGARVASLVLIEPVLFALLREAGRDDAWAQVTNLADEYRRLIAAGQPEKAMAAFLGYWTSPKAWASMPQERRAAILSTAGKVALQWETPFHDDHAIADFAAVECPTLFISGEHTTLAARAVTEVLIETLPNCRLHEVAGAGHMSPVTHPQAVNDVVSSHLRQYRSS